METLSVSVPAKGRGRECSSWGTLGLPWRFQAEGESTSVILGCSTKAFPLRTCWRRKQHCLPRKCLPSVRKPATESSCLPTTATSTLTCPHRNCCMYVRQREACRALLHSPSTCICFCILFTQPRQAETKKMSCEYTQEVVLHLLRSKMYGEDSIYPEDYTPP